MFDKVIKGYEGRYEKVIINQLKKLKMKKTALILIPLALTLAAAAQDDSKSSETKKASSVNQNSSDKTMSTSYLDGKIFKITLTSKEGAMNTTTPNSNSDWDKNNVQNPTKVGIDNSTLENNPDYNSAHNVNATASVCRQDKLDFFG